MEPIVSFFYLQHRHSEERQSCSRPIGRRNEAGTHCDLYCKPAHGNTFVVRVLISRPGSGPTMFKLPPHYSLRLPTILKSEEARQARTRHADNLQLNDWQTTTIPKWGLGFVKTKKSPAQSKLEQVAHYMNAVAHWAQAATDPSENRREAARRITTLLASTRQQTSLSIENLGLTQLPPLPPWIRELNVENNRLASLAIPGAQPKDIRILSRGNPLASPSTAENIGNRDKSIATDAVPAASLAADTVNEGPVAAGGGQRDDATGRSTPLAHDSIEDLPHALSPDGKRSLSRGSSASTIKPGRAGAASAAEVMAGVPGQAHGAGDLAQSPGKDGAMDRATATGSPGGSRSMSRSSPSSDTTIKPKDVRAAGATVQGLGEDEALAYQQDLKDWVDLATQEHKAERIHTAHIILDWIEQGRPDNMLLLPSLDVDERIPVPRGYRLALPDDVGAEGDGPRIEAESLENRR
ncbi:hypothetical protein RY831_27485 [Noviherbaspirillum sp. CPCC 100848]|uniref:Leucine-rich repeat domain-containing protein n=1 Tax=Noviherbaspirillum album TaxID=3080276 RepID=A0ABU6JGW9_9BURK|nr:hypothetical protein [Noviherbaspirillum sp. CPCC 100848]MEC4722906.1 hypothetical protein [Noviherbaspirillum sp. CPCC 100848]